MESMRANEPMVDGMTLRRGSRVRLRPSQRADIVDLALAGRIAEVDRVEEDADGRVHVVVMLDGDPGRDLGSMSQLGHRFFFTPEELEPLAEAGDRPPDPQVLVAGIGDAFRVDGSFGSEVVDRLRGNRLPPGVHTADFGIRLADLAQALQEGYGAAVLLCATSRGREPGTLSVTDPSKAGEDGNAGSGAEGPLGAVGLARRCGVRCRILLVECEPADPATDGHSATAGVLSPPVSAVLDEAVPLVEGLLNDLLIPREPV
ncbi:hydrogenase maturation protease [Halopolyspora algeriensis]|uniref:Hydrogenase maturation protease n=2 Tax=Halopolyspora algeriensis TaxID=1500506 RepID=A0A368VRW5_9ACTN|nr:hydrogenase maturation protease [Halopolyspora algeriensis]TQM56001.1 hydrogenase maturation protease [Halopolyspora algeriensis]